jgi:hypothetical protein
MAMDEELIGWRWKDDEGEHVVLGIHEEAGRVLVALYHAEGSESIATMDLAWVRKLRAVLLSDRGVNPE